MSKLAKLIDATISGETRAVRDLCPRYIEVSHTVSDEILSSVAYPTATMYTVGVKFNKSILIREISHLREATAYVKRAMIEEVFGEFRPIISEMRASLYEEDTTRVRSLIAELENRMFNDGI